jgi:DNA-binding MarR family transcriptional regulator
MPAARTKAVLIQESMQSLRRIVKALEDYSRAVEREFGLTGPQVWALWELGQFGPMSLKDLAERMRLESSTVVGVVDRLAVKELVVRNSDPTDRRRISLVPTSKGKAIVERAPHPAQGHLLKGLESMQRDKVASLHEALATLERVLGANNLKAQFFFAEG